MEFKEKLKLYADGKLSDGERKELETEIEKHEAISDYISEKIDSELDIDNLSLPDIEKSEEKSENFEKSIKRAIRVAFAKAGISVGVIVLAVVLFLQFGLSPLTDSLYYNPTKEIENGDFGTVSQFNLDISVFSEMHYPCAKRDQAVVTSRGYGSYDFIIYPTILYENESNINIYGKISKGEISLYDSYNIWNIPANVFDTSEYSYTNKSDYKDDIYNLDENELYTAYITLSDNMKYEDIIKILDFDSMYNIWLGVYTGVKELGYSLEQQGGIYALGYSLEQQGCVYEAYEEEYPYLSLVGKDVDIETLESDEDILKKHFISMLSYLGDNNQFAYMMGGYDSSIYKDAVDYVNKNGMSYYGFACITDKDTLIKLYENDNIKFIYVK